MESVYLFSDGKGHLHDEGVSIPWSLALSGRFGLIRAGDAMRRSPRERPCPSRYFLSPHTP